jgi:hypothetical protein
VAKRKSRNGRVGRLYYSERGRFGALDIGAGNGSGTNGGYPGSNGTTSTTPKKSGVPIGAAVIVILGVVILSNVK